MEFTAVYHSPMGPLKLLSDGVYLTGLYMGEAEQTAPELPVFALTGKWLDAYFRGDNPPVDVPMKPAGTAFQRRIWEILLTIPQGSTSTYGDIAAQIARETGKEKMSAQAVGQAVGRNPISILIPCHRVVGAQGKLTGYAGGLNKKVWLLSHEGHKTEHNQIK